MNRLYRLTPLLLLLIVGLGFVAAGVPRYLHLATLREHDAALRGFVRDHRIEALAVFATAYAVVTACCLPGVTLLTLAGGYLFGMWAGASGSVAGGAGGAVVVYLAIRTSVGPALRDRAKRSGGRLKAIIDGVGDRAFSYILTLRLFPFVPFWLVSVGAALAGAPLKAYAMATLVGIMPVTFIYSAIGAGVARMVARGGTPGAHLLLEPAVVAPLAALGLLSLGMGLVLRARSRA